MQSRYYDPAIGRFLNADVYASTGQGILGSNMFAYCGNEPVNGADPSGTKMISTVNVEDGAGSRKAIKYEIDCLDQGNTNLCWAYCIVMRHTFDSGEAIDDEEAFNRAKRLGELYHPILGWNNGLPFFLQGKKAEINSINDLYNLLVDSGPVYAAYKIPWSFKGHIVLVTGVDVTLDKVYTNNPWGVQGEQSYLDFLNDFVPGEYPYDSRYALYAIYIPTF